MIFHRVYQTAAMKKAAMYSRRFRDPKTGKYQSPKKLPTFHLVVLPLKLNNATGSPVRAIAFVD